VIKILSSYVNVNSVVQNKTGLYRHPCVNVNVANPVLLYSELSVNTFLQTALDY
jgi:hypothetical protein